MAKKKQVETVAQWLALLRKTELFTDDQLDEVKAQGDDLRKVARWMIQRGWLTVWQAGQLLGGFYRLKRGNYVLCEELERTDTLRIYRARNVRLDKPVLLRMLASRLANDAAFVKRFLDDARAAASLDHLQLPRLVDVGGEGSQPFVVVEWVDGESLTDRVSASGLPPLPVAVEWTVQIADALSCLRRAGVGHGHLSPDSIVVTSDGVLKIRNAGAASVGERLGGGDEQHVGNGDGPQAAELADVRALGELLAFLLTGRQACHDWQMIAESREDVAPELTSLCRSMIEGSDDERSLSLDHVIERLRALGGMGLTDEGDAPLAEVEPVDQPDEGRSGTTGFGALDGFDPAREATLADSAEEVLSSSIQIDSVPKSLRKQSTFGKRKSKRGARRSETPADDGSAIEVATAGAWDRRLVVILGVTAALLLLLGGVALGVFLASRDDTTLADAEKSPGVVDPSVATVAAPSDDDSASAQHDDEEAVLLEALGQAAVREEDVFANSGAASGSGPSTADAPSPKKPKAKGVGSKQKRRAAEKPAGDAIAQGDSKMSSDSAGAASKAPGGPDEGPTEAATESGEGSKPSDESDSIDAALADATPAKDDTSSDGADPTTSDESLILDLPDAVDLPAVPSEGESSDELVLGTVDVNENDLCFISLYGGDLAARGRTQFALRNARGGTAPRDWEFTINEGGDEPEVIATLKLRGKDLVFQWADQASEHSLAGNLRNCALRVVAGQADPREVLLRRVQEVDALSIDLDKPHYSAKWSLPDLPNPAALKIDAALAGYPFTRKPADPLSGPKGKQWILLGENPTEAVVALELEVSVTSRGIDVDATPYLMVPGAARPERLTRASLAKFRDQGRRMAAQRAGLENLVEQLKKVPREKKTRVQNQLLQGQQNLALIDQYMQRLDQFERLRQDTAGQLLLTFRVYMVGSEKDIDLLITTGRDTMAAAGQ